MVPLSLKADLLKETHDDAAHQGQAQTLHLIKQRLFWVGMDEQVKNYAVADEVPESHT